MHNLKKLLIIISLITLTGCGFKPIYAKKNTTGNLAVVESFSQVRIGNIPNREGQFLRNILVDKIYTKGYPNKVKYFLTVGIIENKYSYGIKTDAVATRANIRFTANFILTEASTNKVLLKAPIYVNSSYNILDSSYETFVAEKDAKERALTEVANNIVHRLSIFFSKE